MTDDRPRRGEAFERIERLRAGLGASLESARRAIDTTQQLQASESMQRVAAARRIDTANRALHASVGLID